MSKEDKYEQLRQVCLSYRNEVEELTEKLHKCMPYEDAQEFEDFIRNSEKEKYKQQIADLEAKLAESEKKFNVANNLRKNSDEVLLNYKTEKYGLDKTIQELRKMKLSLPEKEWYYKGFENCERQMSSHIADLTLEVKQLQQQLEEKEKELKFVKELKTEELGSAITIIIEKLSEEIKNIDESTILDIIQRCNQDKISFAVEKLKETKIYVDNQHFINTRYKCEEKVYANIWNFIDNQIKQLKEGK